MTEQAIEIILRKIEELRQDNRDDHQEIKKDTEKLSVRIEDNLSELKKKIDAIDTRVDENSIRIVKSETCIKRSQKDIDQVQTFFWRVLASISGIILIAGAILLTFLGVKP